MGHRPGFYEIALKQQARRKAEKDLSCPSCGVGNRPGRIVIDIDETDDARCSKCDYIWQVRIDGL